VLVAGLTLFVIVPHGLSDAEPPGLREAVSPDTEIVIGRTASDLAAVADGVQIMMTWKGGNPRPLLEEVGVPSTLRWIHHSGIGVDQLLFDDLVASEVTITNMRGVDYYARPMAEYVVSLMLVFAKRLVEVVAQQHERRWRRLVGVELRGKTVGIVGLGTIGAAVAELSRAVGMRVVATRRDVRRGGPDGVIVYPPSRLSELLAESDYVVLCLPRTNETDVLMDASKLSAMKGTAVLINVGRGRLVDAGALSSSLSSGRLRGAALDVFETEPLPSDSPLWTAPNLLVSPHMSASVEGGEGKEVEGFLENLSRFQAGEELLRVVNKERGY
jgi:phosphoglycerate dehydrogenase-like enzyme